MGSQTHSNITETLSRMKFGTTAHTFGLVLIEPAHVARKPVKKLLDIEKICLKLRSTQLAFSVERHLRTKAMQSAPFASRHRHLTHDYHLEKTAPRKTSGTVNISISKAPL